MNVDLDGDTGVTSGLRAIGEVAVLVNGKRVGLGQALAEMEERLMAAVRWARPRPADIVKPLPVTLESGIEYTVVRLDYLKALAAVAEAAEDLRRIAIAEHGHDTNAGAPWPSCLPTHMALNRYRDATDALKEALA